MQRMKPIHRTLVANLERVWFFDRPGPDGPLELVGATENPVARKHPSELETDGPGMRHDRSGHGAFGAHRTDRANGPQEQNAAAWARAIAASLRNSRARGTYDKLDLVVEPSLLGRIRQALDDETGRHIDRCVSKDVAGGDERSVREAVERLMS